MFENSLVTCKYQSNNGVIENRLVRCFDILIALAVILSEICPSLLDIFSAILSLSLSSIAILTSVQEAL